MTGTVCLRQLPGPRQSLQSQQTCLQQNGLSSILYKDAICESKESLSWVEYRVHLFGVEDHGDPVDDAVSPNE